MSTTEGLLFPLDEKNVRSSTGVNQGAFAAAIEPVDKTLADNVRKATGWRFKYVQHLVKQVEVSAQSESNALTIAEAGLRYLHSQFEFVRDGKCMPLTEAMKTVKPTVFDTVTIKGTKAKPTNPQYVVPYQGKDLTGDPLRIQIETWVRKGVIEFSCGEALLKVVDGKEWLDLSNKYFVLLGATSAMGPLPMLLALGANIIAVDIPRPHVWKKLIGMALDSPGSMTIPLPKKARETAQAAAKWTSDDENKLVKLMDADFSKQSEDNKSWLLDTYYNYAGCDLLGQTPEIRSWLSTVHPGKEIVVGAYAYLDGPLFFRLSMAMDAIIQDLTTAGPYYRKGTSLAYLCTPTDGHVVPAAAVEHSRSELRRAPLWQQLGAMCLSMTKFRMSPNARKPIINTDTGGSMHVCNSIVTDQGPNYILAKRLQHWRAMLARRNGSVVSSNIAPATATASVTSNFLFKLAYQGMGNFKPLEVFQQETSNAVMGGLLLNDIMNPNSAANPNKKLTNPLNLFTETAFHGGAWRCAYNYGSVGVLSVVAHIVSDILVKGYLGLYNGGQAVGWGYALMLIIKHLLSATATSVWSTAGVPVYTLTMLTMIEVVNSVIGAVRAPVGTTFVQVFSRVMLAVVCNTMCTAATTAGGGGGGVCGGSVGGGGAATWLLMMMFAWSLTEVVRYSYYLLSLFEMEVRSLTWLRYSLFIVLYPLGVTGEIGCLFSAQAAGVIGGLAPVGSSWLMQSVFSPLFRIMPLWLFVLLSYGPGLSTLYMHMLTQRKKVLGVTNMKKTVSKDKKA